MPVPPAVRHAPHERAVVLRYRPEAPVRFVDLRGEVGNWREPHPLRPAQGGVFEETLHLAPGVYAYKLRHDDGSWHLDRDNARTMSWAGAQNSVLVVGGTEEPVLHAPALPWVSLDDDGRLSIRAGLRRGAGQEMALRWDEGLGSEHTPMRCVAEEDEHLLFEARIPASARRLRYLFEVGGRLIGLSGGGGQSVELERKPLMRQVPAWWKEAVVYTVFVDRFRRGGDPTFEVLSDEEARAGGDLDGVREALPWLAEIGVTVLHLTPIATAPSSHRYAATDPRSVDPALGGEEALSRLLEAASKRGIKILLDVAMTHVHTSFPPFQDVARRGPRSPFYNLFQIDSWPFVIGPQPGYRYYQGTQRDEPLLRLEEPAAMDFIAGTFEKWARLGVAGFRLDAVADVPLDVVRKVVGAIRAVRPDALLFGEVVPDHGWRFLEAGLDAVTEFPLREALVDLVSSGECDAARYASICARRRFFRGGPGHRAIAFTSSHDQPRLRSLLGGDAARARAAQLMLLLGPEVPSFVWGDEIGLFSHDADRGFEGAWPDRMPMDWSAGAGDAETLELVREAIRLRRSDAAFLEGECEVTPLRQDLEGAALSHALVMRRTHGETVIDVCVNLGQSAVDALLPPGPEEAEPLFVLGEAELQSLRRGRVKLGAASAIVLARRPKREALAMIERVADGSLDIAREAFAAGMTEIPSLPPRLYVTVTERCNLRCVHCITRAPALTREGRAREMSRAVLDALAEPFAAARYVGFSHGGESLVSPMFFDVLAALRRARSARPGRADVHLLTNGMRLDPDTAKRVADLGVTSLAFSLDGASAMVNDVIRPGGRFETIKQHILAAARLRDENGYDLRMGISAVVSAPLLTELPALGRLAIELGVEWVKLEEMCPSPTTPRSWPMWETRSWPRRRPRSSRRCAQRAASCSAIIATHRARAPARTRASAPSATRTTS